MKKVILFLSILSISVTLQAQPDGREYFKTAFLELADMLEGSKPLDFERAVFATENAYYGNVYNFAYFKGTIDLHADIISKLIAANNNHELTKFQNNSLRIALSSESMLEENYRKALANWAIYTYITDTTVINVQNVDFRHLPFEYNTNDPFGTIEWKNTQVLNLLQTQKGNCFGLVALYKIFSERFKSEASIVTAPQHIYIEHADPSGNLFNVELATRSFPGTGSIQTLTHTTSKALMNETSMRSLELKQSIALCLIQLAKSYEHKFSTKDDSFLIQCAEMALKHDAKNLNAKLLKAQVFEQRVMKGQMPPFDYTALLSELYETGYRQMPDDMKYIILASIQKTPTVATHDYTSNPYESIGGQAKYVSLSHGVFPEVHTDKKIVRYGNTIFNSEKKEIVEFLEPDTTSYQVDPVVFALSVDPLTNSYPELTPYQFASNRPIEAVDLDGLEAHDLYMELEPVRSHREHERRTGKVWDESRGEKAVRYFVGGGLSLVLAPAITVVTWEGVSALLFRGATIMLSNPAAATTAATFAAWIQHPKNQQLIAEGGAFVAGVIDPNPNATYSAGPGDELGKFVGGIFRTKNLAYVFRAFGGGRDVTIGTVSLSKAGVLHLNFDFPEALRNQGVGTKIFQDALKYFGNKVKAVAGTWVDGDNLKAFNDALKAGKSEAEAIFSTPTGKWAQSAGYTNYTVKGGEKTGSTYEEFYVHFTKPE